MNHDISNPHNGVPDPYYFDINPDTFREKMDPDQISNRIEKHFFPSTFDVS